MGEKRNVFGYDLGLNFIIDFECNVRVLLIFDWLKKNTSKSYRLIQFVQPRNIQVNIKQIDELI